MSTPDELILGIFAKEKRVRELRSDPRSNFQEITDLTAGIRRGYRSLIVKFPTFSTDKVRDVISHLWKNCFYKPIEEFRVNIKQRKRALEAQKATTGQYAPADKDQLVGLTQEFLRFLNDSIRYFTKLMSELEGVAGQADSADYPHVITHIHGCLLYLGDLARYKVLYSEEDSDYNDSVKYYERAALIMPAAGNAQNQLAMLATYSEAESTAVFHYCRSILAKNPFSGGLANLAKLFSLNTESYRSLHRQYRGDANIRFKYFLTSFVRLHSLLFSWTIQMHADHAHLPDASQTALVTELNGILSNSVLKGTQGMNTEEFHELLENLLRDLDLLIFTPKLTDLHLLRLVAICIFSIHFADTPERNAESSFLSSLSSIEDSTAEAEEIAHRTKVQSLALTVLFKLVSRVAGKWAEGMADKSKRPLTAKLLPMLSTFADWAGHHTIYMSAREPEPAAQFSADVALPAVFADSALSEAAWNDRYRADREDIRMEARTRSMMKAAVAAMKDELERDLSTHSKGAGLGSDILSSTKPGMILREHAELRGYLPLIHCCERLFGTFDPLHKTLCWVPEGTSRLHREQNIVTFIKDTLDRGVAMPLQPEGKKDVKEGTPPRRGLLDVSKGESKDKDKPGKKADRKGRKAKDTKEATPKEQVEEKDIAGDGSGAVAKQLSSVSLNKMMYSEVVAQAAVAPVAPVGVPEAADKPYGLWSFGDDDNDLSVTLPHNDQDQETFDQQWAALQGSSSQLFGELDPILPQQDYLDDLLDEDVVFKPAFARLQDTASPMLPSSRLTSAEDLLSGLRGFPAHSPTAAAGTVAVEKEVDIWASLGVAAESRDVSAAVGGGVFGRLGLGISEFGSSSLFSSDWSEGLLGQAAGLGAAAPSMFAAAAPAMNWDAPILGASGVSTAPPGMLPPPPGMSGPPPGMALAPPPGIAAVAQPQQDAQPASGPPGLRGPPKQAYLGNAGSGNAWKT